MFQFLKCSSFGFRSLYSEVVILVSVIPQKIYPLCLIVCAYGHLLKITHVNMSQVVD